MMDIEKLIEQLSIRGLGNGTSLGYHSGLFDEAATALAALQTENAKLRAELEKAQYERDYPCIYFKAGGLCRYGGDESEANICVMGPCDCEMTAADVDRLRSELEQVKREKDAAASDLESVMAYRGDNGDNLDTCQFCKNGQCYVRGGTKQCLPQWRGQKEE